MEREEGGKERGVHGGHTEVMLLDSALEGGKGVGSGEFDGH